MGAENSSCDIFPKNTEYCSWLLVSKRISASFSVIGCLCTIVIIWLFRKYTEFSQRMIVHLSAASLFQAVIFLSVQEVKERTSCTVHKGLMQFTAWVILLWILAIIINLFLQVMCTKQLSRYEGSITLFCWLFPGLISTLPFASCDDEEWKLRLGVWYILPIAAELFLPFAFIVFAVMITYRLRKTEKSLVGTYDSDYNVRHKQLKEAVRTLWLYPVVYFVVILFPTINRIVYVIRRIQENDAYTIYLEIPHTITEPLDGLFISLAFVLDRRTRRLLNLKSIKKAWRKKFKGRTKIHEFVLNSRLSVSDLVVAARVSISTIEVADENAQRNDKDLMTKVKSENLLETISETENNFEVIIRRKKSYGRRVSQCVGQEQEVDITCHENANIIKQEEDTCTGNTNEFESTQK